MTRLLAALCLCALLVACGERPQPDDPAFHSAVQSGATGTEVTFDATVEADPYSAGTHERLQLQASTGENVEVDHNTSLAPWVPAHQGDHLIVHGQLYIDPGRIGVHCTHSETSSGCPSPGWIELNGSYYE